MGSVLDWLSGGGGDYVPFEDNYPVDTPTPDVQSAGDYVPFEDNYPTSDGSPLSTAGVGDTAVGGSGTWGESGQLLNPSDSGGFMDHLTALEAWIKAHPFVTKLGGAGVIGLGSLLGNIASASANKKTTKRLLDQQAADKAARDHPDAYPGMAGSPGLQPQYPMVPDYAMLGTNPLSVYANPNLQGYQLANPRRAASGGLMEFVDPDWGLKEIYDRDVGFADGGYEHGGMAHEHGHHGGLNSMRAVPDSGMGGQDDDVPAMLSSKEYVFDADTVAALGDGNADEGARRLDRMRENIRRHKRAAPAHKIPPKSRAPEHYLRAA